MALTPKQERFVQEYLIDLNATQAAIRAGYSVKTAYSQGERLLRNAEIKAAIEKARLKLSIRAERTVLDVLKDIQEVTREARDVNDHRAALKGLEMEGRHLGMFTDRLEHSGGVELVVVLPEVPDE